MAGKRKEAEAISKWLGSLGEISDPPAWFFEFEAAKILGCSYLELTRRPDKAALMTRAFTYGRGKTDGEYLREKNPKYQQMRRAMMEEAKRGGNA